MLQSMRTTRVHCSVHVCYAMMYADRAVNARLQIAIIQFNRNDIIGTLPIIACEQYLQRCVTSNLPPSSCVKGSVL